MERTQKGHSDERDSVVDWANDIGLVRHEITLKGTWLTRQGLRNPWAWTIERQQEVLRSFAVHNRVKGGVSAYSDIALKLVEAGHSFCYAGRAQQIVQSWLNGDDQRALLPPRTFYRYRKMLLGFGIDIGERADVRLLPVIAREIRLIETKPPAWYRLPGAA
jgi:hypothetical protein